MMSGAAVICRKMDFFLSIQRCRLLLPSCINSRNFSSLNKNDDHRIIHDVIIIGGGPTGLFLSSLLSSYNNRNINSHLLFDKRPQEELLKHPQAHFINLRSMEILKAEMPRVYDGIKREMPHVSEWEGFHFCGSVMGSSGRSLGKVVHPVKGRLRVGQSGNAMLLPTHDDGTQQASQAVANEKGGDDNDNYISVCQPAHLAQNKFVSLLLNEAKRRQEGSSSTGDSNLRYGEEVTAIKEFHPESQSQSKSSQPIISIHTSHGHTYQTRYLIAADGVHSFARKSFGNIPMMGKSTMQNLINVHFRTNQQLSKRLMKDSDQAMLHFVYNPHLVGAFVCHDGRKGEWVLQIPFFPPYQTMDDFSIDKVRGMVAAGLGMDSHYESNNEDDFDVLSIRPWTMSSLVAELYVNKSNNLVLVGDAAHAFPPAGGFGMNTGLQDVHNLAWRLALLLQNSNQNQMANNSILAKYESERKPIATQNAALSVRNYNRTLRIAKACYLDAQHPALLTTVLGSPPMSLLPLETRQDMFRKLVRVAMMPLASLASLKSSLHANHIERNVQSILKGGGSLPLVFPRYEIGFSYEHDDAQSKREDASDDTKGYHPRMKVGHRLPHVTLEVLRSSCSHANDDGWSVLETTSHQAEETTTSDSFFITLTDISSQLRRVLSYSTPVFTLLVLGPISASYVASIREAADEASHKLNTPFVMVNILHDASIDGNDVNESGIITLIDSQQVIWKLMSAEPSIRADNPCNAMVIVRPDGHISSAELVEEDGKILTTVEKIISQGLESAVGNML